MKKLAMATALLCVLALAGPAAAEYGSWEQKNVDFNYNNTLLGVYAPTETDIFSVGVWTDSISTFRFIWKSTDGGDDFHHIYQWQLSPNPADMCDILKITDVRTSGWMIDAQHGVFGGMGVSQACLDMFGPDPIMQMICVMVCAFTIGPSIWHTDDGGETFTDAQVTGEMEQSVQAIHFANDTIGYAVGLGGFVNKTTNGGQRWNALPDITQFYSGEPYFNGIHCVDANTCWMTAGQWDPDPESADDKELEGEDRARHFVHQMMLGADPSYRDDYWATLPPRKDYKYTTGAILFTDDGGQTWTVQKESATEGYDYVYFKNADTGWVMGSQYVPPTDTEDYKNLLKMYWTNDGGQTWTDYVGHLPGAFPGLQGGWAPTGIKFVNDQIGFLYGYGARVFSYGPAFLFTDDGGQTWTPDESAAALNGGQMDLAWVNPRLAYSVGLYINLMKYVGANSIPIADAGEDRQVMEGAFVTLDGSGSHDPDGEDLSYAWTQSAGPAVALNDANTVAPSFDADQIGELTFSLIVYDGTDYGDPDDVVVTVIEGDDDDDDDDDDTTDDDDDNDDDDTADDDVVDDDDNDDDDNDDDAADDDTADEGDDDDDNGSCGC